MARRTKPSQYKIDPTIVQSMYNSIKSLERGEPVPLTRNIHRRSEEWGEERTPQAITFGKWWRAMRSNGQETLKILAEVNLRRNSCEVITYFCVSGNRHYVTLDLVQHGIRKTSIAYDDKHRLLDAVKAGRVKYIHVCEMPSGS